MRNFLGTATTVTATEKWLAALQAGQAFGGAVVVAPLAGNISEAQLFNPNASGKTALVRAIAITPNVAALCGVTFFNTALATDNGALPNLLSGAAASVCHMRSATPAAIDGTIFYEVSIAANGTHTPFVEWFCQLAPNQGMVIFVNVFNVQLTAAFMIIEQ